MGPLRAGPVVWHSTPPLFCGPTQATASHALGYGGRLWRTALRGGRAGGVTWAHIPKVHKGTLPGSLGSRSARGAAVGSLARRASRVCVLHPESCTLHVACRRVSQNARGVRCALRAEGCAFRRAEPNEEPFTHSARWAGVGSGSPRSRPPRSCHWYHNGWCASNAMILRERAAPAEQLLIDCAEWSRTDFPAGRAAPLSHGFSNGGLTAI